MSKFFFTKKQKKYKKTKKNRVDTSIFARDWRILALPNNLLLTKKFFTKTIKGRVN